MPQCGSELYYVLDETGGSAFKEAQSEWLAHLESESDGSTFGEMIGLRDDDVHLASTGAEPLAKYVSDDRVIRDPSPYYQPLVYNAALFGPAPVIEEKNPDGVTVTGSTLHGAVGLYITQQGRRVEVTNACSRFIEQLASLLSAIKTADKGEGR